LSRSQQAAKEKRANGNIHNRFGKHIAAHAAVPADAENLLSFASEKELPKLAAEWPGARLVEVWNSFAGVAPFTDLRPVKKFTDRKAAVARVWSAVQRVSPEGAQQAADVALAKEKAKKAAAKAPRRARAQKGADQRSNKKAGRSTQCAAS
jgi:hypothetical protein